MAYLRSDIAGERKPELEFSEIESICVEVNLDKIKWLICGSYKPPSLNNNTFQDNCDLTLDKAFNKYDNIMIIGDLNFNMLEKTNSQCLNNVCDIFSLDNIIDTPTYFPSNSKPTLSDVILTNKKDLTCKTCN